MNNWQNRYDSVEKGWIINEPSIIRVTRKLLGHTFIGFVDETGYEIIPCKYLRQNKYYFQDDLLEIVGENEKIGFVNKKGIEVIKCQYDKVSEIHDNIICVSKDEKWGIISKYGTEIIPLQYRFLGHMGHGRILAQKFSDFKVGALDYEGKVIIPFKYYQLGRVTIDKKIEYSMGEGREHGFLDINGNVLEILPF